jgi:hypothetical protein
MFDVRFAKRMAARYRKKGQDENRRRMVELLAERGVQGATVLEIGGGVGEIQLEWEPCTNPPVQRYRDCSGQSPTGECPRGDLNPHALYGH